jgi:hypothetical protein
MPFQEKSAIAMTAVLVAVYGAYFALMGRLLASTPAADIPYQPLLIVAVVPLTILAAVSHIVLAVASPKEANAYDERDRLIVLRSERLGGYVLVLGVVAGLVLAMAEIHPFFIANALLLGWVLAEIADNATRIVLYRRGT